MLDGIDVLLVDLQDVATRTLGAADAARAEVEALQAAIERIDVQLAAPPPPTTDPEPTSPVPAAPAEIEE